MDLNEIEREADLLAGKLVLEATGRNEALLLGVQLEGLKDLATIKALCNSRAEHNVAVDLRQRELAAMEQVAANMPTAAPCGEASPEIVLAGGITGRHYCRYPTGHSGLHRSPQGTEWGGTSTEDEIQRNSVANELHALASHFYQEAEKARMLDDSINPETRTARTVAYEEAFLRTRSALEKI